MSNSYFAARASLNENNNTNKVAYSPRFDIKTELAQIPIENNLANQWQMEN